jgi:large repetitive protein
MDGPNSLGVIALSGGGASFPTSALTVGDHSITVVYGGDAIHAANTSPVLIQTVNKAPSTVVLTSSLNPSPVGQQVNLTAQVSPASATGSVQFFDSNTLLGAATLSGGNATLPISSLALGAHSITAVYSGDGNLATSTSQVVTQNIATAVSSVTLTSSANPVTVGQVVTFRAQVNPAFATGLVQFLDGGTSMGPPGTLNGGVATFSTSSLKVGSHSITASYAGDANDAPGASTPLPQVVSLVTSSVTVSSSVNPSTPGQAVTFAAQVSPSSATGSITFMDGTTALGTAPLSGGQATLPPQTALIAGPHSITAVYSGDGTEAPSTSSPMTQTVSKLTAGVTLASSANPSLVGQAVTFIAQVTPTSATGSVQFFDGTVSLGKANLTGGTATLPSPPLAAGSHSITAVYSGDGTNAASTSAALPQTVSKVNTTVTVNSSLNPSTLGVSVTFVATVTPSSATGSVQFTDGATSLGVGTLSGGKASTPSTTLAVGAHLITATYSGDATNAPSVSVTISQTVNKVASTVTLTPSVNPSTFGQPTTFTANVTPGSATGNVQFMDGAVNLGTVAVNGGIATLTPTPPLAAGTHSITAIYSGDGNTGSSTSATVAQTVNKEPTTVTLTSSASTDVASRPVIFTATVSPNSATGSVTFLDGGKSIGSLTLSAGKASFTTSALTLGAHAMTASYGGDANNAQSVSNSVTVTVIANVTTGTLRPPLQTISRIDTGTLETK